MLIRQSFAGRAGRLLWVGSGILQHPSGYGVFIPAEATENGTLNGACARQRPAPSIPSPFIIAATSRLRQRPERRRSSVADRAGRIASGPSDPPVFDRALLETLPIAVYVCDRDGALTHYNRHAAALWGSAPDLSALARRRSAAAKIFHPDVTYGADVDGPMAKVLRSGDPAAGIATTIARSDSSRLPCLVNIAPLRDAGGEIVGAIATIQDLATRGRAAEETLMPFPTPLHDASGALVGAVDMLMDISDRKRAEQTVRLLNETLERRVEEARDEMSAAFNRLHESERRFRLLVEGVSDYAIYMLDPGGCVTNWNSGAERIKGYAADEIIGQHFSRFYSKDDRADGVPHRALETARTVGRYEAEGWRVRKDGSTFWASVVLDAIRDEAGDLVGFGKVTRDLTEKRAAEEHLRQAQKMEAIGQLTGGVAHDFNNLLTAIVGNLELLAAALPEEARAQRYAAAALRAASRGSQLTEQLLAFSRRQALRPEIVGINNLLQEILTLCQRTAGDGIELVLRLQGDLWTCHVDAAQFGAAIFNLLGNARDAMDGSGQIAIATENVATGAADGIDLEAGDYVVLSVTDTGCGMSAAVLSHAFEPFYTTKEVGKGTGLGLSQVYGFAKQSGGAARIESRAGVGTTVRLYLPRSDGELAGDAPAENDDRRASIDGATILVVDDDQDVREVTVDMLSRLGYRILAAATGPEALAILRRDKSIDLLFSDVVMPAGMSGIELARAARRVRPDIGILLSSAHPGNTQAQPIHREFPFITKPYRPSTLGPRIVEVLAAAPAEPSS
jgi:PAS domain S-box-containing protein